MKAKTARRKLRRNEWKMARMKVFGILRSYSGFGKKWKVWVKEALKD
jgi:hypothetical protein